MTLIYELIPAFKESINTSYFLVRRCSMFLTNISYTYGVLINVNCDNVQDKGQII